MQVDFVDDIAKIMSADDSIPNADAMQTLIRLIGETSTPLGATEQELLRTTLMATAEKPLLESFSHSPALIKVAEWLAASLQQDVTLAWLALLGHMPMTIKALTWATRQLPFRVRGRATTRREQYQRPRG